LLFTGNNALFASPARWCSYASCLGAAPCLLPTDLKALGLERHATVSFFLAGCLDASLAAMASGLWCPGLKARWILVVTALAIGLGALAFALPLLVSSQTVRQEVAKQLSDLTGRPVALSGDQPLQVFPQLSVRLRDVMVEGDPQGPQNALIMAESLEGGVRPLPLLFGRVELSSLTLTRPIIRLVRHDNGERNWALDGGALLAALEPTSGQGGEQRGGLQLGTLRILDGTIIMLDETAQLRETLSSVTLSLSWPSSSARAVISGEAIWRGEAVALTASLDQPSALAQPGSTSGMVLSLASAPLNLRFDGALSPARRSSGNDGQGSPWQAAGRIEMTSPSLRRALTWMGHEMEPGSTLGPFSLEADINALGNTIDLLDMELVLDGNEAEGVLTLAAATADRRAALQGTLDFERLDLSTYLASLRPTSSAQMPTDWRFANLPDLFSGPLDVDVRFASRELVLGPLELQQSAGSIILTPDRLVMALGQAIAYEGSVRASLTMVRQAPGMTSALDLSADAVQLGQLFQAWFDTPPLTGALQVRALVQGEGISFHDISQTMRGDASLLLEAGTWDGVDVSGLIEQLRDRGPDENALDTSLQTGGQTRLARMQASLMADRGMVRLEDVKLENADFEAVLAGRSYLPDQSLALDGSVLPRDEESEPMAFAVQGTWAQPRLVVDTPDR
jgi:AsmA protein